MSLGKFIFKDYEWEQRPCNNRRGFHWVYSYRGKWKQWNLSYREWVRYKLCYGLLTAMNALLFLYGSSVRCEMNQRKEVQVCSLLGLGAVVFLAMGVVLFLFSRYKMKETEMILQKFVILWSARLEMGVLVIAVLMTIVGHGLSMRQENWITAGCFSGSATLALILGYMQQKLNKNHFPKKHKRAN